jgi:hypothetical protein
MGIGSKGMIEEAITQGRLNRGKGSELSAKKCAMQGMATLIICHSPF